MHGEGVVNLGLDLGDMTVDAVGVVDYDQNSGETSMNLTTRFTMPIDKGSMEAAATRIAAVEDLKPLDFLSTTMEMALVEWTDQKTADKFKSDYTIKGEIKKMPNALETAMIFTGVRIKSFDINSMEEKGLISSSNSAVLVNMYEKPVLKYIPTQMFFQQLGPLMGGDRFGVLINIPGLDYYFDYRMNRKDGEMRIISGDKDFNDAIAAIKEEKRKTKNFKYEITTQRIYLSKFLNLFER